MFCADFIDCLPKIFHSEGKTIFKERNELKIFERYGMDFVVKLFKKPHFINAAAYTTIRTSKAERAYMHALILKEKEILTPTPVAFIEIKKKGLLFDSYFIARKSRFYREIRELSVSPGLSEAGRVLTDFARFTVTLHQKGVLHKDYSPGNILFGEVDDHYEFELVDLNRMKFCEVNLKDRFKNLRRLCFNDDMYCFFAKAYTAAGKLNMEESEVMRLKYLRKK